MEQPDRPEFALLPDQLSVRLASRRCSVLPLESQPNPNHPLTAGARRRRLRRPICRSVAARHRRRPAARPEPRRSAPVTPPSVRRNTGHFGADALLRGRLHERLAARPRADLRVARPCLVAHAKRQQQNVQPSVPASAPHSDGMDFAVDRPAGRAGRGGVTRSLNHSDV